MNTPIQKFECWAILELFGHSQIAGYVSEQNFGPATFFRVEVPETETQPKFDRMLNPSAVYAINPVDETTARYRAGKLNVAPITGWDVRDMIGKMPKEHQQRLIAPDESEQRVIESFGANDDDDLDF